MSGNPLGLVYKILEAFILSDVRVTLFDIGKLMINYMNQIKENTKVMMFRQTPIVYKRNTISRYALQRQRYSTETKANY